MYDVFTSVRRALLLTAAVLISVPALGEPPEHAKAHGWRKKNDPRYVGYTGRDWDRDYGVLEGKCNREEIGTVVGAVAGGAIGSQVGDGDGRTVAIIVGSVLGAAVGRAIGADLDDADRGCVGHALELSEAGRAVRWVNDRTHISYALTPLVSVAKDPKNCRRFSIEVKGKKKQTSHVRACRNEAGVWKVE